MRLPKNSLDSAALWKIPTGRVRAGAAVAAVLKDREEGRWANGLAYALARIKDQSKEVKQVNVHQAKTQLSRLLASVEEGERVVIARHGKPVAELIPARKAKGFPLGIGRGRPLVPPGDAWWQPMTGGEAEEWLEGR